MAVQKDGSLGTGQNDYGQLGDGTKEQRNSPVQVMEGVDSVAAGAGTVIAKAARYGYGETMITITGQRQHNKQRTPIKLWKMLAFAAGGGSTDKMTTRSGAGAITSQVN